MSLAFLGAYFWLPLFAGEAVSPATPATGAAHGHGGDFKYFEPLLNHEKYNALERTGLISVLIIAIVGLLYALMLRTRCSALPRAPRRCRRSPQPFAKAPTRIWVRRSARSVH